MPGRGDIPLRRIPVETCLAAAVAVSGLILVALLSELTFITDEWELVLVRRGWGPGEFLDPFHEHIVLAPAIAYKLLLAVFGMDSAAPFQLLATATFLFSAVLLFVHLRPRVGDWAALLGAAMILFLGGAFEDLLFAFQLGYYGSVAAGLGMLIVLDRGDRRGDLLACILLIVSLSFSSLGIPFAAGAVAHVLLSPRPRRGRLYLALLPIELWGLWWLGWGHGAESAFSLSNLSETPEYVFDAAAAGITTLLGLATGDGSEPDQPNLVFGQILLVAGVVGAGFRLRQLGAVPRGLLVVLAIALSFWILSSLNLTGERFPTSSRYQYPSAVFLLLIAGELLRGVRFAPLALAVGAAVVVAAAIGGMSLMLREHEERWVPSSDGIRATLAGLEIAGDSGDPGYPVVFTSDISVSLEEYLDAVRDHGSPAFSEEELLARPPDERSFADLAMAEALGLALTASPAGAPGRCEEIASTTTLPEGRVSVANDAPGPVKVFVGRFSDGEPISLGQLPAGTTAALTIPPDGSLVPWRLTPSGGAPVRVCLAGAA